MVMFRLPPARSRDRFTSRPRASGLALSCSLLAVLLLACLLAACAAKTPSLPQPEAVPAWGRHFAAAGVNGTFVLLDQPTGRLLVHDPAQDPSRSARAYLPASTFKILNSLIALDTGVAKGPEEFMAWDGVKREFPGWNQDLDLRQAFAVSAVWYFQALARRIGPQRMAAGVARAGYGNADIGGAIDRFWLDGNLRVSALEQVDFLRRLAAGTLPFAARSQEIVRDLMALERGEGYVLRAKTGWAARVDPQIGWLVGWVERPDGARFFALNIDMPTPEAAKARFTVARAILKEQGLIP